jgi:hypothetical protein
MLFYFNKQANILQEKNAKQAAEASNKLAYITASISRHYSNK